MKQCAAERIVRESKMVPPQKWFPYFLTDTCQGIIEGALEPPTMRSLLGSSMVRSGEFRIQDGTVAESKGSFISKDKGRPKI